MLVSPVLPVLNQYGENRFASVTHIVNVFLCFFFSLVTVRNSHDDSVDVIIINLFLRVIHGI